MCTEKPLKYLDFDSHHPLSHKRAVVSTAEQGHIALQTTSELTHISHALWLTLKIWCRTIQFRYHLPTIQETPSEVHGSTSICAQCVKVVKTHLDFTLHPSVFQAEMTIKELSFKPKHQMPDLQWPGFVHRIPCASCPACCIGQRGCRLHQCIEEHKQAVSLILIHQPWKSMYEI